MRGMQAAVSRYSFPLFFCLWLLLFFPGWYGLSYTKVRELQASIGQDRNQQLRVLHPTGEMAQLIELQKALQLQGKNRSTAILLPVPDKAFPLASDPTMLRAVLYPVPLLSRQEIPEDLQLLAVVVTGIPATATASGELELSPCQELVPETYTGEVLCWPILPR